ncbi:MAG: hypothetical protein KDC54_20585 [Lewinella sp.]|nr:hypothetical protein [Lewinella sp.]
MKKLILFTAAIFVFALTAQAQDGKRALRDASNALRTFNLDQTNNLDKLHEAVENIGVAMADDEVKADATAWSTAGEIYNAVGNQITTVRQLGLGSLDALPQLDKPAIMALDAYLMSLELSEKRFQEKEALRGLRTVQGTLNNLGIFAYEDGDFQGAYEDFNGVLRAHEPLVAAGEESLLADDASYQEQLYLTGLAALNAEIPTQAKPIFEKLIEMGYDKPVVYEAMYKITAAENGGDLEAAYVHLEEGRQHFPDDVSLLFAEINHFLRINKLDVLIGKLETAIEKEPDNVSLYSTMGSVYDNLYQREAEAGNDEQAKAYFDKALEYFNSALAKEPDFTDAIYSIGALYFNRAASMTQELSVLADDLSREGQAKYEELKTQIDGEFDKALPFFQRVERMDPNDLNTLIALKEIYARKNEFEISNEFKNRVESIQMGETLESYFENN